MTPHYKKDLIPLPFSSLPDSTIYIPSLATFPKPSSTNPEHQIPTPTSQLSPHTLWKANNFPSQYETIGISPKMTHNYAAFGLTISLLLTTKLNLSRTCSYTPVKLSQYH